MVGNQDYKRKKITIMQISGFDYIIYSSSQTEMIETLDIFFNTLRKKWQECIIHENGLQDPKSRVEYFFAPNQKSFDSFEEYKITPEEESSCFWISGEKTNINEINILLNKNENPDGQSLVLFDNCIVWTLVLPELLDKHDFVYKIYNLFIKSISDKNDLLNYSYLPKPVQSFFGKRIVQNGDEI